LIEVDGFFANARPIISREIAIISRVRVSFFFLSFCFVFGLFSFFFFLSFFLLFPTLQLRGVNVFSFGTTLRVVDAFAEKSERDTYHKLDTYFRGNTVLNCQRYMLIVRLSIDEIS